MLNQSDSNKIQRIVAIGGGSKSTYWLKGTFPTAKESTTFFTRKKGHRFLGRCECPFKTIATALGIPIDIPEEGSDLGAAFGAARLAIIASERLDPEKVCLPSKIGKTIDPNSEFKSVYEETYRKFKMLYHAVRCNT